MKTMPDLLKSDQFLIQKFLKIWLEQQTGTLDLEWEELKKNIYFFKGKIAGCFSQEESDEPRNLLLEKGHPAAMILESLNRDPSIDPFFPVFLLENKILSVEDFCSLLSDQARKMIFHSFEKPNPRISFLNTVPRRSIMLNLDTYRLIETYIMEQIPIHRIRDFFINIYTFPIISIEEFPSQLRAQLQKLDLDILAAFSKPAQLDQWLDDDPPDLREKKERRIYLLIALDLLQFNGISPDNDPHPANTKPSVPNPLKFALRLFKK